MLTRHHVNLSRSKRINQRPQKRGSHHHIAEGIHLNQTHRPWDRPLTGTAWSKQSHNLPGQVCEKPVYPWQDAFGSGKHRLSLLRFQVVKEFNVLRRNGSPLESDGLFGGFLSEMFLKSRIN